MSERILQQISPFVRLAHDFHCQPGWELPRRQINDHALLYFKSGAGKFLIGSKSYPISPGTLFVIRPDVVHSFSSSSAEPFHMHNLHFDLMERRDSSETNYSRLFGSPNPRRRLEVLSTNPEAVDFLPVRMKIDQEAAYEGLFQTALNYFFMGDVASKLGLKAVFMQLLAFLFRQVRAQSVSPRLLQHLPQLERAAHFMGATLDRPLALTEVARAATLSRSYFATSFRNYYGMSPARFHLRQRIEKAATALTFGGGSVKEVAEDFGFQTVHHFSRCFRRVMGMPPAAYRLVQSPAVASPVKAMKTNGQKKRNRRQRRK
jgi:AraC-like DNA-binding protein/quercetin dioxygenase-like cupin family protein